MEILVNTFLSKLQDEQIVDTESIEIYQFGLECMLLKVIHFASYLLIGILTGELLSLLVSLSVFIPLRKKAGGYHAKTRTGCYIFSCIMVLLMCIFNKIAPMYPVARFVGVIISDILILHFAPVENENRELDEDERIRFRKQVNKLLLTLNGLLFAIFVMNSNVNYLLWIENGLFLFVIVFFIEITKKTYLGGDSCT